MLKRPTLQALKWPAFAAWVLLMGSLGGILVTAILDHRFQVDSHILHLLPKDKNNPVVEQAIEVAGDRSGRYWFFLLGADNKAQGRQAAQELATALSAISSFNRVSGEINPQTREQLMQLYWQHRRSLLSERQRLQLEKNDHASIINQALSRLYSPLSPVNSGMLAQDPFLSFLDFAEALQKKQLWQVDEGWLTVTHAGKNWVLVSAELADSPFSVDLQDKLLPGVDAALASIAHDYPDVERVDLSTLRYAAAGVDQARAEISTIGLGSSIGIALMLLLVFRSATPLLLSMLPALCGYLAAVTVCWLVFGPVHLMVLVMGSSLLGLSNDYSLHFFVDRDANTSDWRADATIHRIFTALTLGMATSVIAFVGLLAAPFPGMQQLALFSAVGLLVTYLTVMCLYPVIIPRPRNATNPYIARSGALILFLQRPPVQKGLLVSLVVSLLLSAWPLYHLVGNDDVRLLQNRPADLLAEQQRWQSITGMDLSQEFFLVTAADRESLLQREESLTAFLDAQIQQGDTLHYQAISNALPSVKRQRENRERLRALAADTSLVASYREQSGLPDEVFAAYRDYLDNDDWLSLEDMSLLESSGLFGLQYIPDLGHADGGAMVGSLVSLDHVGQAGRLKAWAAEHPGIYYVDKTGMVSSLFKAYRHNAVGLLIASYIVVAVLLIWLYGIWRCFWVMVPPLSAAVLTIAIMGACGHSINLFHCLGLILVLGAGIDYTLFLEEAGEQGAATWLTIILSAVSTVLSFGLLALSETAAVSALGLTVLLGISLSLLLAPLAFQSRRHRAANRQT